MAIINVAGASQLLDAISNAHAGDTILLASANYGALNLNGAVSSQAFARFGGEVTIKSANAENPAVFSSLALDGVSNLTFDGVEFDMVPSSAGGFTPFSIARSSNISIRNSNFDGHLTDGFGDNQGLLVSKSANIIVENSKFSDFYYGAGFNDVVGLKFVGNDLQGMAFDGSRFAKIVNGLIEGNYYHDMKTPVSGGHRDMIQFWTEGDSTPSQNVTIRKNVITVNDNLPMQSIFIYNEEVTRNGAGSSMFYQNFLIEDNHIEGSHPHGITVGPINGLTIRNNVVVQDPANDYRELGWHPRIDVDRASLNVTISGNTTNEIANIVSGWTVSGNRLVPVTYVPTTPTPEPEPAYPGPIQAPTAGNDTLTGTSGSDTMRGAGGDDQLLGYAGNDTLRGDAGNDVLRGMSGNDRLVGGAGRDILVGGTGPDVFDFDFASESVGWARDILRAGDGGAAFEGAGWAAGDRIDLSGIDANVHAAGNQMFGFGGTGTAQVSLVDMGTSTLVRANTDYDAAFEFELVIEDGGVRAAQYIASDFIL